MKLISQLRGFYTFSRAVAANDDLWALDKDGLLFRRRTYSLELPNVMRTQAPVAAANSGSVEEDWELI